MLGLQKLFSIKVKHMKIGKIRDLEGEEEKNKDRKAWRKETIEYSDNEG